MRFITTRCNSGRLLLLKFRPQYVTDFLLCKFYGTSLIFLSLLGGILSILFGLLQLVEQFVTFLFNGCHRIVNCCSVFPAFN